MDIVSKLRDMQGKKYSKDWATWVQVQCTEAADEIELLRETLAAMVSHCDERSKGWDTPKGRDYGDCEFGARHEARALAAQLREIAGRVLSPNA